MTSGDGVRGNGVVTRRSSRRLDEPTELPNGEVIELVPLDDLLAAGGDYLDEDERRKLHASIDRGLADVEAGRTVESASVIERLRARAWAR